MVVYQLSIAPEVSRQKKLKPIHFKLRYSTLVEKLWRFNRNRYIFHRVVMRTSFLKVEKNRQYIIDWETGSYKSILEL